MSIVTLESIKRDLRLTHDEDDVLLQDLIDASENEAMMFMNRTVLPGETSSDGVSYYMTSSDFDPVPPSATVIYPAICLLVRAKYYEASPDQIADMTNAARSLLMPYRVCLGV